MRRKAPGPVTGVVKKRRRPGKEPKQISYAAELGRKAIHVTSSLIPLVGFFTPWKLAVLILGAMCAVSLLIDVERTRRGPVGDFLRRYCGAMLRDHERRGGGLVNLSGATWLLASATMCYAFFTREVATAALFMLILCDTAAALVGRRFGTIRFGPKRKSVEGSFAFLIVGVVIAQMTPGLPLAVGIIGAVAATIAEAIPGRLDDNLSVPMSAGFAMMLAGMLL